MRGYIILPTLLALAACSSGEADGTDSENAAEATAAAPTLGLPEGFTALSGMEVTNDAQVDAADGTRVRMITLNSDHEPSDVGDHFRAEAAAAGYEIGMDSDDGSMVNITASKEGAPGMTVLSSNLMGTTETVLTIGPSG